ncbi:MAG TPA: HD domain-containing protein [Patescibacteria group bacterium]|nr:HD domain-containing protein [Patescibacteria group bacterium]
MDDRLIQDMEEWFRQYVRSFYCDDEQIHRNILLKEAHTAYVSRHCGDLAESLGLDEPDRQLAILIGLLHDVGRFKQYSRYRTFNDAKSVNHALLGLEEIEELDLLERLSSQERECLEFAIAQHNVQTISSEAELWFRLHARVIRDADKLDIYRVLVPDGIVAPMESLSPVFLDDLRLGRQSDYRHMRTPHDHRLIRLNWIYDVNFSWTMRQIVAADYVPAIFSCLPQVPVLEEIAARMLAYMDEKCRKEDE